MQGDDELRHCFQSEERCASERLNVSLRDVLTPPFIFAFSESSCGNAFVFSNNRNSNRLATVTSSVDDSGLAITR